jgi:hypothetical protein
MDIDYPRFDEALRNLLDRVQKYDERIVTILKCHLGVEQVLNDLLREASRQWRRRSFAGKIDVAEKLFLPELDPLMWAALKAGNNLRNAVAHGHKDGTVTQRRPDLRKALLEWASPEQRPGIEGMADPQMVSTSFFRCASFIVVATGRLEGKS